MSAPASKKRAGARKHVRTARRAGRRSRATSPLKVISSSAERREHLLPRVSEFTALYGNPLVAWSSGGMHVYVFVIDPDGWGLAGVRRSIHDSDGADSLLYQHEALLAELGAARQKPGLLVVAEGVSGRLSLEHRPDIRFISTCMHAPDLQALRDHPGAFVDRWGKEALDFIARPGGWMEFVAFYSADRLSRNVSSGLQFVNVLDQIGIDLYLTQEVKGAAIDIDRDDSLLRERFANAQRQAAGIVSASERTLIKQLERGRAPHNRLPPGFGVGEDKFPTDTLSGPEGVALANEWAAIHDLHRLFGTEGASAPEVSEHVKASYGLTWTPNTCLKYADLTCFVTGQITLADSTGRLHDLRHVALANPVSESAYRRTNLQISVRERKGSTSRESDYLAGGVRILCGGCIEQFGVERASEWGGRRHNGRSLYRRREGEGCSHCAGFRPDKDEFETKLAAAFLDAAERLPGPVLATPEQLDELRDELDEMEAGLEELLREIRPYMKDSAEYMRRCDGAVDNAHRDVFAAERRLKALEVLEETPLSTCPLYDRNLALAALRELLREQGWDESFYRAQIRKAYAETLDHIIIEWDAQGGWDLRLCGRAPAPGWRDTQALYPLEQLRPLLLEFLVERRVDIRAEQVRHAQERGLQAPGGQAPRAGGHTGSQRMPREPVCPPGVVSRRRLFSRRAAPRRPLPPGADSAWVREPGGALRVVG